MNYFQYQSHSSKTPFQISYNTYGTHRLKKQNTILVFHALSGSHNVTGTDRIGPENCPYWNGDSYEGWWKEMVGPGKAIDTDRYFVVCFNYLGGCYGSSGPASINPDTDRPYGGDFPAVSIQDQSHIARELLTFLGVDHVHAVIGPSVGGLCALQFAVDYPDQCPRVALFASGIKTTVLTRLTLFEQIMAIENDQHFKGGHYYDGEHPWLGLALARMISHKTFVHIDTFEKRAKKEIKLHEDVLSWYKVQDPFQSYMLHQGKKFVQRFDPNSYLRIIDMWSRFNLFRDLEGNSIENPFEEASQYQQKYLIYSIDSDYCFYPEEQKELVHTLEQAEMNVTHLTVHSDKGHDSFLLEPDLYSPQLRHLLQ